jgi:DNA polymerase III delta' subunit
VTSSSRPRLEDLVGQQRPVTLLRNAIRRDRVAHAYLFSGPELVGKSTAARLFAQSLNCEAEESRATGEACGECRSCSLIERRSHPDVRFLTAADETDRSVIPIEGIREELVYDVHLRPLAGRHKIYILDPADRTAHLAIQTILKVLEEPPPYVVTILVTSLPALLPPTIPSRCQQVVFQLIGTEAIEQHLLGLDVEPAAAASLARLSGGRIGWAIEAARQPGVLAARKAILDLCAGLHSRGLGSTLRVAEEVKLQALALAGARREAQAPDGEDAEKTDATPRGLGDRDLRMELPWCLDVMVSWYHDVLSRPMDGSPLNTDNASALGERADPEACRQAERAIESLLATKRAIQRNANIDLALESLSIGLIEGAG